MKRTVIVSMIAAAVAAIISGILVGCTKSKKYVKGHRWFDEYDPCDFIYEEDDEDE